MDDEQGRPDPAAGATGEAVFLDARNLRALAHPLRVQLLGLLRHDGPSTASRLAERTGLSSAATSYHLRQLAAYGFVVEAPDAERGHQRERWWRAAHRSSVLEGIPYDPDALAAATEYLRAISRRYAARTEGWLDEMPTAPPDWRDAADLSDAFLQLTPEEAAELTGRIHDLVMSYRRREPDLEAPRGSRPVSVQWQVLPQLADGPDDEAADDRPEGHT